MPYKSINLTKHKNDNKVIHSKQSVKRAVCWYYDICVLDKESLNFRKITSWDYTFKHCCFNCIIENSIFELNFGSDDLHILISSPGLAPAFVKTFQTQVVQPGSDVEMACSATGIPGVTFSWSHNGRALVPSSKFRLQNSQQGSKDDVRTVSILTVADVEVKDSGLYTCKAVNDVDVATHDGWLKVFGRPIVSQLENVTVTAGENVHMHCYVAGYPITSIAWRRGEFQFD